MTRKGLGAMAIGITLLASGAMAGTDMEIAINKGGQPLSADQIAELLIGSVVTAKAGDKTFRFYYDPGNTIHGELTNGGWKGSGAFAITDNNFVCVSMVADKGRYRCLTVVQEGTSLKKFNVRGEMTFELFDIQPADGL